MEKMINQMFEIENKANKIILRAMEQKSDMHDDHEIKIAEMEKNISKETEEKLSILQDQINDELSKELQELILNSENRINNLQSINQNEHDVLVDQIIHNIVNS